MGINVLSVFDGVSCGLQALKRSNIKINKYYSSEVDKYAIKVSSHNFPEIDDYRLGDITEITNETIKEPIDLLIGGSSCQNFSFAGNRKGSYTVQNIEVINYDQYFKLLDQGIEFGGESHLFFHYVRLLKELKPEYFLLENVKMSKKWEAILSKELDVEPTEINSKLLSCQNRPRLYWSGKKQKDGSYKKVKIPQPEDRGILLSDIMTDDYIVNYKSQIITTTLSEHRQNKPLYIDMFKPSVRNNVVKDINEILEAKEKNKDLISLRVTSGFNDNKVGLRKSPTIRAKNPFVLGLKEYEDKIVIRRLTARESARCQTISDDFEFPVSDTQFVKCVGNGFTIDVIVHILSNLDFNTILDLNIDRLED